MFFFGLTGRIQGNDPQRITSLQKASQLWHHLICARVDQRVVLGMGDLPPLIGNPYNGYIGAPTIGLMSLSPIIWKSWEFRP